MDPLPLLTVGAQISALVLLGLIIFRERDITGFVGRHALVFGLLISLGALAGSLWYSEIKHFEPCSLCWYQRIFMYPQVFLFAYALWKRDRHVLPYSIILSIAGIIIAFYHSLIQYGIKTGLPCPAGGSISCTKVLVLEYGYITIPLMSLTTFVLLVLVASLGLRSEESH